MIFVETPAFCRWREDCLTDDEFCALQNVLITDPRAGDVIPGARGLRKVRVALRGRGKRGGARVIYFWWASEEQVYLLFAYSKNVSDDLTPRQLGQLVQSMREEVDNG
ncbi:MAG: type II toxin-antitoxin system RelE/ParE family toxin [Gammaproteobacteria bacterium]